MYIPRQQNPWEQMIPQMLQTLFLAKVQQNMRQKELETEIKTSGKYTTKPPSPDAEPLFTLGGQPYYEMPVELGVETFGEGEDAVKALVQRRGENILEADVIKSTPLTTEIKNYQEAVKQGYKGSFIEWIKGIKKAGATRILFDMTKKTQGDLENEIVQGKSTLAKLDEALKTFRPEFLEYAGKGKAWLADKASKLGISRKDKFLEDYSKWKAVVDAHTLLWRKFITGVAGGEKEMEAIERTTINTKYDSPISFLAKAEQIKKMTEAAIKRAEDLLNKGFIVQKMDPASREKLFEANPLENYGYQDVDIPGDYEIGGIYEDANGIRKRYLGNGIWGEP